MPFRRFLLMAILAFLGAISARAEMLVVDDGSRVFYVWAPDWQAKAAGARLFEIIEAESTALSVKAEETVFASTCSQKSPLADKLFSGPVPRDPNKAFPVEAILSKKAARLPDVLAVIGTTDVGARALALFMPGFGYTFKIEQMTNEIRAKFQHNREMVAAAYDPVKKTLYFNREEEIGKVAFVLLHEMVHSLDKEAAVAVDHIEKLQRTFEEKLLEMNSKVAQRTGKLREELQRSDYLPEELVSLIDLKKKIDQAIEIRSFRTERLAHDASFQVWKQLSERYPNYYQVKTPSKIFGGRSTREIARSDKTPFYYDDDFLVAISGLSADVIRQYKAGKCKPLSSLRQGG